MARRVMSVCGSAAVALAASSSALGQATFQPLLDSQDPARRTGAKAVSGDGSVVAGWVREPGPEFTSPRFPARWPSAGGPPEVLATYEKQPITSGNALKTSWSGAVAVGFISTPSWHGFAWNSGGAEWCEPHVLLWSVSADGATACGHDADRRPVLWPIGQARIPLPFPEEFESGDAIDMSSGGEIIVGEVVDEVWDQAFIYAAVWRRTGGTYEITVFKDASDRSLAAVSPDGTVTIGYAPAPAAWRRDGPPLVLTPNYAVTDVSRRGARIVGYFPGLQQRARVWTAQGGSFDLQQTLETEHGLDLTGWQLRRATGISDDGTVIVGEGRNPQGQEQGWRVTLPMACAADWNFDGVVNSTDVSDFINEWFVDQVDETLASDVDGNGVVNSTDVSEYINRWFEDVPSCG